MPKLKIKIPADLDFSTLKLARDPGTGDVIFDWAPIERICDYSGIDIDIYRRGNEDNVAGLITVWYGAHLAHGGTPDPVTEDLISEIREEDARGGGFSHPPGRG